MLIVDDNLMNILAVEGMLLQFNLKCDKVVDSEHALEFVKAKFEQSACIYKLIMMDYSMPDLDGPGVTRAIRKFLTDSGVAREQQSFICCMTAY